MMNKSSYTEQLINLYYFYLFWHSLKQIPADICSHFPSHIQYQSSHKISIQQHINMNSNLNLKLVAGFGRKFGKAFRKKLPLDYKKGDKHTHRNMHAIPMETKAQLMKENNWKKIRELQRQSLKPFGKFVKHRFIFDQQKLPFYDIPNLEGCELKPYVEFNTPKLDDNLLKHQTLVNQNKMKTLQQKAIPSSK